MIKLVLSLLVLSSLALQAQTLPLPNQVNHFAFGSCAKERMKQPIWNSIANTQPELFLFIGDNHYADYWLVDGENLSFAPVTKPERIVEAYEVLAAIPEFAAFKQNVPMLGTWDDHDYGANDAGKEYPLKQQSQQAFLDFFGFSTSDPIRQQAGIYHARTIGEKGRKVQFIMLDTRYHRDALYANPEGRPEGKGPYLPTRDTSTSMLGEQQWSWLEQQLKQTADIRFIVSSIQVVAYQHSWEAWGTMPHERQRLYNLIAQTKANGVVFLSGDRHLTEVSVDMGQRGASVPYPMWDFTASGMTDKVRQVNEGNQYRLGDPYRGSHFGTITIEWADRLNDTQIVFNALDESGGVLNTQQVKLGMLQHNRR